MLKISDFGLTRNMDEQMHYTAQTKRKLPLKWISIEALENQEFTTQSDVWSFGIVIYEIVTLGVAPYPTVENIDILAFLKTGQRMQKPSNCPDNIYEIMMRCWLEDPNSRPSFGELKFIFTEMQESGTEDYLVMEERVET